MGSAEQCLNFKDELVEGLALPLRRNISDHCPRYQVAGLAGLRWHEQDDDLVQYDRRPCNAIVPLRIGYPEPRENAIEPRLRASGKERRQRPFSRVRVSTAARP